jgi:hypothetical protein
MGKDAIDFQFTIYTVITKPNARADMIFSMIIIMATLNW